MEPQQNEVESIIAPLKKVTPLSKYLAMGLFFILPFLAGWIGYESASDKLEIKEAVVDPSEWNLPAVEIKAESTQSFSDTDVAERKKVDLDIRIATSSVDDEYQIITVGEGENSLYQFSYPTSWDVTNSKGYIQIFNHEYSSGEYKKGWGEYENKIEGGHVVTKADLVFDGGLDFSKYSTETIKGRDIYTLKNGYDGEWSWTMLAIPFPDDTERVVQFVIYGDTRSIQDVAEVLVENFIFLE